MRRLAAALLCLSACTAIDQLKTGVRQGVHDVKREVKETGAGAALAGCGPKLREPYEMDAQQEYVVGRTAAARQLAQLDAPVLPPNDPLARYVDRVGQLLALAAEAHGEGPLTDRADPEDSAPNRPWPLAGYHFIVVDTPNANAFGGPGGVVMITTGMIAKLKDEEELAGVLAHEVAHVKRGHGVEAMKAFICKQDKKTETQAKIKETATTAASALPGEVLRGKDPKEVGAFLEKVADGAMGIFTAGYPEEYELEADRIACRYLVKAGYHPWAVLNVLQRLQAESNGQDQYLQNHPPFDERIQTVKPVLSSFTPAELQIAKDDIALRAQRFKSQTARLQPKG